MNWSLTIAPHEVEFSAIRAQGPGGQHVNTASTSVQLRFDVMHSRLPDAVKAKLCAMADSRVTADGIIIIKSQESRSQLRNKEFALARLNEMIAQAAHVPRVRKATKPTFGSKQRRLEKKTQRSEVKAGRGKVNF